MQDETTGRRRRALLATAGAALASGLAGCAALSGEVALDAGRATVARPALDATRYDEAGITGIPFERRVTLGPASRDVRVTNMLAEYDRRVGLDTGLGLPTDARAAVFATFTTPAVEVFGRTLNPVGNLSTAELADLIQQHYGSIRDLSQEGRLEGGLLGSTTTLTRFTARAELLSAGVASTEVPIYLYVGNPVRAGPDFVLTVAAHPQAVGRREDTVRTLLSGVEHETAGRGGEAGG
ncbi:DUF6517 family protein [Haloglomus litoreum]|uniref:DUF6517 family protein n=1 Tax=Haloglomus litoreum TaxID=3034026 RepID=UPI0023E7D4A1|nr:DUF6517 family protein [Haloglomus sp. DT116]